MKEYDGWMLKNDHGEILSILAKTGKVDAYPAWWNCNVKNYGYKIVKVKIREVE